jgi:pantothenate kinase
MNQLNYNELLAILSYNLDNTDKNRYFISLSGPPASGKSTISEKIINDLNSKGYPSSILQMDGFHLDDQILKDQNLISKKGAPETFDVMGLISFLSRLQIEPEVIVPIFDRSLELSRSSATIINKETKVILVEGNYLLLKSKPWDNLQKFFDVSVMISCEEKVLEKRLLDRWKNFNLSKEDIYQKVYQNDLPNGLNVLNNSSASDYILTN